MLAIRPPVGQAFVIAPQRRPFLAWDVNIEITVQHVTQLDVSRREMFAGQEGMRSQPLFRDIELGIERLECPRERRRVALRGGCADDMPEHGAGEIERDVQLGPLGPFVDVDAGLWSRGQKASSP